MDVGRVGPRLSVREPARGPARGVAHALMSVSLLPERYGQIVSISVFSSTSISRHESRHDPGNLWTSLLSACDGGLRCRSMVILRCTRKLLAWLKHADDLPSVESTTRLGDWYGNILRIGRRQHMIFISERSRLPVIIPFRESKRLGSVFSDAVCQMLEIVGVSAADIADERARMLEMTFARTNDRSLLGTLNDFSFVARWHFHDAPDATIEDVARGLLPTPIMPLKGASPTSLTLRLFRDE
jgi:hypothetical protein